MKRVWIFLVAVERVYCLGDTGFILVLAPYPIIIGSIEKKVIELGPRRGG